MPPNHAVHLHPVQGPWHQPWHSGHRCVPWDLQLPLGPLWLFQEPVTNHHGLHMALQPIQVHQSFTSSSRYQLGLGMGDLAEELVTQWGRAAA